MAEVIDHDGGSELMGLRNFFDRLPINSTILEPEKLPLAIFAQCFDSGDIDRQSGQAEMRSRPAFGNGEPQFALIRRETLLLRTVKAIVCYSPM